MYEFKKAYRAEWNTKRLWEEDLSVNELQPKKKGRSLFLVKKLNNAVQEHIIERDAQLILIAAAI